MDSREPLLEKRVTTRQAFRLLLIQLLWFLSCPADHILSHVLQLVRNRHCSPRPIDHFLSSIGLARVRLGLLSRGTEYNLRDAFRM